MSRKIISLLVALTLLMSLVAIPAAMAEDTYELNVMWVGNGNSDRNDAVTAALSAYLTEKIGCTIKFNIYGWDVTQTGLPALQAGEKIDVFFTANWLHFTDCVQQGLFQPLNDLLQSDGQDILKNINPLFLQGSAVNGVNYAIPTNKELAVPDGWLVNMKAAEEVGLTADMLSTINSCAQLEPYIVKYKELHPEAYPYLMEGCFWPDEVWYRTELLGTGLQINPISQKNHLEADGSFDDKVYNVLEDQTTLDHLALMNKWYNAGYINPESDLTTFEHRAIFTTGDWLFYTQPLKGNGIKAAEMVQAYGSDEMKTALANGETPVGEIYGSQPKVASEFSGSMLAIPTTSENPQKAMQFINLLHSDKDFVNMMLYGIKGEDWDLTDGDFVKLDNPNWFSGHGGAWTMGNTSLQYVQVGEDPQKNEKLISYADDAILLPNAGFSFDTTVVETELAAVKNVIAKYHLPLFSGKIAPDDASAGVEAYKADLKAAGIDAIAQAYTEQYAAWLAAK